MKTETTKDTPKKTDRLTFADLCRIEPGLADLMTQARAVDPGDNAYFCANEVWHRDLKPSLVRLVGWLAVHGTEHPELTTCEAYDTAYQTIYETLPACRECACVRWPDAE